MLPALWILANYQAASHRDFTIELRNGRSKKEDFALAP